MQFINSIIKDVIETNDGDISINDILDNLNSLKQTDRIIKAIQDIERISND